MNLSIEQLIKLLKDANKKIKYLKLCTKKIRKQRNDLQFKLNEIENVLNNTRYYFDKYDYPSDRESYELQGKVELKEDLLKIINSPKHK